MTDFTTIFMLFSGLLLGLCGGFVMHRSDFCIAGMFRDIFLFGSIHQLRALLLLVISSMLLFELARQFGLITLYPFPLFGSPSLSNAIGGFFFGIGMVLAGGCVVGTLYKMGAGSILSVAAFIGLIAGSGLYAEFYPWWAAVSASTTVFKGKVTLPQILDIDPLYMIGAVSAVSAVFFFRWHRQGVWTRQRLTAGPLRQWQAALILSMIGLVSTVIVGMPLGITTAYAKIAGYLENMLFSPHVQTLAYFKTVPLHYRQTITGVLLSGGPGPQLDAIALIQFPVIAGIILGSSLSAIMLREFRIYLKLPWRQYLSALIGGIIMGIASRMAPACNIWHLLGGLPIFAVQSILFLAGLLPGAWLGSLLLSRVVIK